MDQTAVPAAWSRAIAACDLALAEADLQAATRWAQEASAAASAPALRAAAHHRLGVVLERSDRLIEALAELEQAAALDEADGGPVTVALARDLHSRGVILGRLREADRARVDLEQSLGITDRLGGDEERLTTLLALAPTLAAAGDLAGAAARYEQALGLAEQLDGQHSLRCLRALGGIAELARARGLLPQSHRAYLEVTRRLAGLPGHAPLRLRAELGLAWAGLGWLAEEGRGAAYDARAMFSFVLDLLSPEEHPAARFALARLEALGGPLPEHQHPRDPAEPPVVVYWNTRVGVGDLAHPFGGRWSLERARAGGDLQEGDRVPWEQLDQELDPG
jgi:tetratricopeptide (TPR) repeat protein